MRMTEGDRPMARTVHIPDADLRSLLQRPFHSQGYRVLAAVSERHAGEGLLATITPSAPGVDQTVTATVHVDTGAHQADLMALCEFDTARQFVDQIATFAACPGEFLDEAAA
jgi:hypothetical protein